MVKIVIEPLFEASFRPGSYGFRPKRSAAGNPRSEGSGRAGGVAPRRLFPKVHPQKVEAILGIDHASRWFCYCWPSRKSMQRIRDKVKAAIGRDNRLTLQERLDRLNPILRGWSAYFGWLNSAQHFRKVDQFVTRKLRRWLQAKHQRRRRAFWKTPPAYWREAGLYSTQGRIVHRS